MKKLRLVMSLMCDRNCDGCCNKQVNWNEIEKVKSFDGFEEVFITGGEPLLFPSALIFLIEKIRSQNKSAKIIVYTAMSKKIEEFLQIMKMTDGMTLTIHNKEDILPFMELNRFLQKEGAFRDGKSMRLNIFKESGMSFSSEDWVVKSEMEWIEDCPLPCGEVLMKMF